MDVVSSELAYVKLWTILSRTATCWLREERQSSNPGGDELASLQV